MAKKEEAVLDEPVFTKEQLLNSKKYRESADIVGAVLVSGQTYTFKQVDAEIDKFMKRKVETC